MRSLSLLVAITLFLSCSKKNKDSEGGGCAETPYIAPQAYSIPAWHPGGQLFIFNHVPLSGISLSPCYGPKYKFKSDSVGFYIMKKDGTGLTRVKERFYRDATWSPDGNKLLYLEGSNIFIVPFNGTKLDTAQKKLVGNTSPAIYPLFNASSDSIYFCNLTYGASNKSPLYKVALDGTGKTEIKSDEFYELSFGSNKRFYYITNGSEIWSMDQNGNDAKKEITAVAGNPEQRRNPEYYDGKIFYLSGTRLMQSGSNAPLVESNVMDFAISPQGEIIYSQFEYKVSETNKQNGVFWIMNADGSNKRQLTFNNF
jgi:Tol biopolymer transport system component